MPVISIAMHPVPHETKAALISTLTRAAVEVTRLPEAAFTILIHELPEEAIGCGGRTLKEVRAAQPA